MNLNYLYTPVQTIIDPPINTNCQELPFEKLCWEDFEKLCLTVVQVDFPINDCEIYGIKGQSQEGIDIYARQANGRYNTYQCKRYQEFDLGDLNKAVEYFKEKKFYSQSDSLHLCTSCEWNKTQIQDRFEELKTELEKVKITLVKWDKIQLSRILKTQPQIVFDFFGVEWVKKFNGEPALQQIPKSKKFDAKQIAKFRKELYEFYSTIFNIQDPGIPVKELNSPYTIQDRFIIPDILSNVKDENFENTGENTSNPSSTVLSLDQEQLYYDDYYLYGETDNQSILRKKKSINSVEDNSIDIRITIDEALIGKNKNIVIGDPGAGKSTLLRYIALDILSSCPQLENISQEYGKLLPVWLPFAFITKQLSQNDTLSISEILSFWFNGFGKNHLFEIANLALQDDRLFLIIDGIDEWNSISSAQQAITRIETIRELYDCKVLYSSRPYGFRILKDFFTNLKILNLAGFSSSQQRDFIERWYNKWASLQNDIKDPSFSKTQTDNFIKELEQTGDLRKLAETPLLLSILIIQKMRDSVLPKNKLEALKEITQYLIDKHPAKRVSDAGIVKESAIDINFKDIFCELAIYIQKESNDGVILKSDAQKIIEKYLTTYADYDKARARMRAHELIEVGANNFGIIVEKSNDEISFSHKQFQEFLASQYLFESDEEFVNEFINKYAANPTFHPVIINLFGLLPLKQVKKYKTYFETLNNAECAIYQENYLKLISYEVAINLDNAPSEILSSSFASIINDFEYETDPLYKEALLKRILNALQNGRLKEKVQKFLIQYFPNQIKYRDYRVNALRYSDQLNLLQIEFLQKSLINGTIEIRYDASYAFKKHIKNEHVFDFIKTVILNCSNPEILAFAINSIITSELEQHEIDDLLKSVEVEVSIVQFFLYKYKVFAKKHNEDDLEEILSIVNEMPYQLKQEAIDLLIDGYSESRRLKETLIKSVKRQNKFETNEITIDNGIAWKVLFHCFNKDEEVVNLTKNQFQNEEYPFISAERHEMFRYLNHYFKDNNELIHSVEIWLDKRLKKYSFIDPEVAFASLFVHSDSIKNMLLVDLPTSGVSHWNVKALLEGWPDDGEIKEKLKDYFRTIDTKKTSYAAHFISKVFDFQEKKEAIQLLEDILFDRSLMFRERAIPAIIELDKIYFENNILLKLIGELESFPKDVFEQYYTAVEEIVKNYHSNPLVQSYVLERIEFDENLFSLLVRYFPKQIDKGQKILKKSMPLSKELRLLIIEEFNELSVLPENIEAVLSDFDKEEQEELKADMAICLFNHIKHTNKNKIIDLITPIVFKRGPDYEVMRNIAFTGFLVSQRLDEYFAMEDNEIQSKEKASPVDIFNDYSYNRSSSGLMIKSIIVNFDYLISITGKDFTSILEHRKSDKNIENIWGFFARHSVKSSPSYPYIIEYISDNTEKINSNSLISFLSRTSPNSAVLKDILLRIITSPEESNKALAGKFLGIYFNKDSQVYEEVKKVQNYFDSGRIVALCNGWANEPILKEIFDEIVKHQYQIDDYVGFNLKFLFRDVDNITDFLKSIFSQASEIKRYHKYFFIPMIERLKKDNEFSLAIKRLLLSSSSINEKISYYNLLSHVNMVDDDVRLWKSKITEFKNDYGYDIVSNKTVRLKDVLYDYYF